MGVPQVPPLRFAGVPEFALPVEESGRTVEADPPVDWVWKISILNSVRSSGGEM